MLNSIRIECNTISGTIRNINEMASAARKRVVYWGRRLSIYTLLFFHPTQPLLAKSTSGYQDGYQVANVQDNLKLQAYRHELRHHMQATVALKIPFDQ